MSIENAAKNIENEAIKNPSEAAASMKLLGEAQQERIVKQIEKDATQQNADFSVDRDKQGHVTALHFTPLFKESTGLGNANSTVRMEK